MSKSRSLISVLVRRACLPACLSLLVLSVASAEVRTRGALTRTKFDPSAERVELFKAVDEGQLELKVIPKDSTGGLVYIQNNSEKPLTVDLPKAIVGVQVLKQFDDFGGGGMGGGYGGDGGGGGGGGGQAFGGGMGGMGMMGGGMGGMGMGGMGGGGGFFSIPPEKVVKLPYQSVCLDHGKAEPHPRMNYRLMAVEDYTDNEALRELITIVGSRRIDQQAAQAAAWHLDDGISWQELATKRIERAGGLPSAPYFSPVQLYRAQEMVSVAVARSREQEKTKESKPVDQTTPERARVIRALTAGR